MFSFLSHLWCLCVVSCFQETLIFEAILLGPQSQVCTLPPAQADVPMSPGAHCGCLSWKKQCMSSSWQVCLLSSWVPTGHSAQTLCEHALGRHPEQQAGLQIARTAGVALLRPPVEAPAHPQVHAAAFCPAQGGFTHHGITVALYRSCMCRQQSAGKERQGKEVHLPPLAPQAPQCQHSPLPSTQNGTHTEVL